MPRVVPFRSAGFGDAGVNQSSPIYQALQAAYVRVRLADQAAGGTLVGSDPNYTTYTNAGNLLDGFVRSDEGQPDYAGWTVAQHGGYAQTLITALNAIGPALITTPVPPIYQEPGPAQPADPVNEVPMVTPPPTGTVVGTVPPDPNTGTVAVILPSGEVVVGAGTVHPNGTATVTTASGGTVTGQVAPAAAGGFLSGIENSLSGMFQGYAEQFGISVQTLEIIAVVAVLGGLYLLSGKKRR